jgi:GDP-4-dehydro-6-deoxy-D-mannose reductase
VSPPVILVTGAGGFAGSHLLEHLAGSADLVGWSRSQPPADVAQLARWQQVDIRDRDAVTDALRTVRPSSIFHCAGFPHVAESWHDTTAPLAVNVLGTHRILDALSSLGIACRLLITGSSQVYASSSDPIDEAHPLAPSSPYGLSKLAQEQLALLSMGNGVEVIVTRSFNHTGPRQTPAFVASSVARQIALIERGTIPAVIKVGNLAARRDVSDVRDVVRAYAALMKAGTAGTVYNVASGVGRPVQAIVEALVARARVPIRIEQDPARLRANDIPVLVGNPARLKATTGWEPQIPFEHMIDDLLEYWRGQDDPGPTA